MREAGVEQFGEVRRIERHDELQQPAPAIPRGAEKVAAVANFPDGALDLSGALADVEAALTRWPEHYQTAADGAVREHYETYARWLAKQPAEVMRAQREEAEKAAGARAAKAEADREAAKAAREAAQAEKDQ